MERQLFNASWGIIPALDVDSIDEMLRVVEKTCGVEGIVGYKLGLTGSLRLGLEGAVKEISGLTDLPVIYDHQKAGPDMPDMASKFSALCGEAGVNAVILFPVAGPEAVRAFVGEALNNGLVPIVGGHIPVPDYCVSGGGFLIDEVLFRIIAVAAEEGARHFVFPANDVEAIARHAQWIRTNVNAGVMLLTGFGPLGGSIQSAIPAAAECRSRFGIVGREICRAEDPAAAAMRYVDSLLEAVHRETKSF